MNLQIKNIYYHHSLIYKNVQRNYVFCSLCVDWGLLSVADDIPVLDIERSKARILSWASLRADSALKALSSAFWALSSVALKEYNHGYQRTALADLNLHTRIGIHARTNFREPQSNLAFWMYVWHKPMTLSVGTLLWKKISPGLFEMVMLITWGKRAFFPTVNAIHK